MGAGEIQVIYCPVGTLPAVEANDISLIIRKREHHAPVEQLPLLHGEDPEFLQLICHLPLLRNGRIERPVRIPRTEQLENPRVGNAPLSREILKAPLILLKRRPVELHHALEEFQERGASIACLVPRLQLLHCRRRHGDPFALGYSLIFAVRVVF